jgi:hypothetical protein
MLVPGARVATVLAAQLATHPAVWLAMATLPGPQLARLAIVEVAATGVEAAIYARRLPLARCEAIAVSVLANAASLLAGATVSALGALTS